MADAGFLKGGGSNLGLHAKRGRSRGGSSFGPSVQKRTSFRPLDPPGSAPRGGGYVPTGRLGQSFSLCCAMECTPGSPPRGPPVA